MTHSPFDGHKAAIGSRTLLGAVALAFTMLGVGHAQACEIRNFEGPQRFVRADNIDVDLNLSQSGRRISGTARFYSPNLGREVRGTVEGETVYRDLNLRIYWDSGAQGGEQARFRETAIYNAGISANGEAHGMTHVYGRPETTTIPFMVRGAVGCLQSSAVRQLGPSTQPPPRVVTPDRVPGAGTMGMSADGRPIRRLGRVPSDDACATGFVWRMAGPSDRVCVASYVRARTLRENQLADSRRDPNGANGPNSCIAGFVWRDAFPGDQVCVAPYVRAEAARDNQLAPQRRASR